MPNSMPRRALAAAIALAFSPLAAAAPLFYEPFDISAQDPPVAGCNTGDFPGGAGTYPFPPGWLLRNVDNGTPNAAVAYINDAWEVREDFAQDSTNCVAFSTSWYQPAGTANDWMWTPAIALPAGTSVLSWRAKAYDPLYPDGYEVRVMGGGVEPTGGTGVIGNQITNSTIVFSVGAEAATWTQHGVSLDAFAGQTIRVGFRNNSVDKFVLVVDDVSVVDSTPDLAAVPVNAYTGEYSRAPDGFSVAAPPAVAGSNLGGAVLNNLKATATIERDGVPFGAPLSSTPVASLAIGASTPFAFGTGGAFSGSGQWSVHYVVKSDESASEADTANNELESPGTSIGGNEFARHEGPASGVLGIGAGNGGEIGAAFVLAADATFDGIRFAMGAQDPTIDDGMGGTIPNPWAGLPLVANLRAFDGVAGKPGDLIDTTVPVASTYAGGVYDVKFVAGAHTLAAGTYVVTVSEPPEATMSLLQHAQRFTPGTAWVIWPTSPLGGWANSEDFGPSFARTPEVSLLAEVSIFKDGFDVVVPAIAVGAASAAPHAWRPPSIAAPTPSRRPAPTRVAAPR